MTDTPSLLPLNLPPLRWLRLIDAPTKHDEHTATHCPSVTSIQAPLPWNISASRCVQHCKLETYVIMIHLYPFLSILIGGLILLWVSAKHFEIYFFTAMPVIHLPISPSTAVATHSYPGLASSAMRRYFLLVSKTHHAIFLRPCFPYNLESLPHTRLPISPKLCHTSRICTSVAHRLLFSSSPMKTAA